MRCRCNLRFLLCPIIAIFNSTCWSFIHLSYNTSSAIICWCWMLIAWRRNTNKATQNNSFQSMFTLFCFCLTVLQMQETCSQDMTDINHYLILVKCDSKTIFENIWNSRCSFKFLCEYKFIANHMQLGRVFTGSSVDVNVVWVVSKKTITKKNFPLWEAGVSAVSSVQVFGPSSLLSVLAWKPYIKLGIDF